MKPDTIVIHHSLTNDGSTVSWNAIWDYHVEVRKWKKIAYQFGIERVGNRYMAVCGRMPNETGAHTIGVNQRSIGICIVGNFDKDEVPMGAFAVLIDLVRYLMDIYEIGKDRIFPHSRFADKTCPGVKFPWDEFIEAL